MIARDTGYRFAPPSLAVQALNDAIEAIKQEILNESLTAPFP